MRLPLIDGQGNFGSVDGDNPAAYRYTECRLAKPAMELLRDIDKDTVDFQANYDNSEHEPLVLPAGFPNLLVNGAGGIAVGMATNIPPHNLGEVIDACVALIDNPALSIEDLIGIIPGPDFPTGGIILGQSQGIRSAYHLGRGSASRCAARSSSRPCAASARRSSFPGNSLSDEQGASGRAHRRTGAREEARRHLRRCATELDRDGYRVVIEMRRDAVPDVVLTQLYRFTALKSSFGVNIVALDNGRPQVMNLKDLLRLFIAFREEVIFRRTKHLPQ